MVRRFYLLLLFLRISTTLWMRRKRQIMAATVMLVHQASSRPREETMFLMVLRERTPKKVPTI